MNRAVRLAERERHAQSASRRRILSNSIPSIPKNNAWSVGRTGPPTRTIPNRRIPNKTSATHRVCVPVRPNHMRKTRRSLSSWPPRRTTSTSRNASTTPRHRPTTARVAPSRRARGNRVHAPASTTRHRAASLAAAPATMHMPMAAVTDPTCTCPWQR